MLLQKAPVVRHKNIAFLCKFYLLFHNFRKSMCAMVFSLALVLELAFVHVVCILIESKVCLPFVIARMCLYKNYERFIFYQSVNILANQKAQIVL